MYGYDTIKIVPEFYSDGINWNVSAIKWNLNLKKEGHEFDFIDKDTFWYGDNGEYPTYEDALEFGLQLGLKMI